MSYDHYNLLVKQTTDPLGNRMTAEHDYRQLLIGTREDNFPKMIHIESILTFDF
jgi:hypothetical protein